MQRYPKTVASHKTTKRQQRTLTFWDALARVVAPFTIIGTRGAYYQAESAGLVPKTDEGYTKVQRALVEMRRDGVIPYTKVRDSTRVRRRVWSVASASEAADRILNEYRYDHWINQPTHVEVWCEKEALSPQLEPICQHYGVHYASTRGFDSESFMYETAEQLRGITKPIVIYYLGDHDPSGWWVAKTLEQGLYDFGIDVAVYHLAVLPWQIRAWDLPVRRAGRKDSRYPGFVRAFGSDMAVEVDAITPDRLARMVQAAIESHIEPQAWSRAMVIEKEQRRTTESVMQIWKQLRQGNTVRLSSEE